MEPDQADIADHDAQRSASRSASKHTAVPTDAELRSRGISLQTRILFVRFSETDDPLSSCTKTVTFHGRSYAPVGADLTRDGAFQVFTYDLIGGYAVYCVQPQDRGDLKKLESELRRRGHFVVQRNLGSTHPHSGFHRQVPYAKTAFLTALAQQIAAYMRSVT